jgi:hypothetical protein
LNSKRDKVLSLYDRITSEQDKFYSSATENFHVKYTLEMANKRVLTMLDWYSQPGATAYLHMLVEEADTGRVPLTYEKKVNRSYERLTENKYFHISLECIMVTKMLISSSSIGVANLRDSPYYFEILE